MLIRLGLLVIILLAACQEKIIHDLNELDANKIISKLHLAEIESRKEKQSDGLWSISVPKKKVVPAIQLIEDYRFFKKPELIETKTKLLSSDREEKLIYENSLARQLETTLQSLAGVLEAHVHFNINLENTIWKNRVSPNQDSTSGVLLIVNKYYVFTNEEIKQLVEGASGISQDKINIVISYPAIIDSLDAKIETTKTDQEAKKEIIPTEINTMIQQKIDLILTSSWLWPALFLTLFLIISMLIWQYQQIKKVKFFKANHLLNSSINLN